MTADVIWTGSQRDGSRAGLGRPDGRAPLVLSRCPEVGCVTPAAAGRPAATGTQPSSAPGTACAPPPGCCPGGGAAPASGQKSNEALTLTKRGSMTLFGRSHVDTTSFGTNDWL